MLICKKKPISLGKILKIGVSALMEKVLHTSKTWFNQCHESLLSVVTFHNPPYFWLYTLYLIPKFLEEIETRRYLKCKYFNSKS